MLRCFEYGWLGVYVFFVISGFVVALTLDRAEITPRFCGVYALRRSIRLDPCYWATMAIVIVMGLIYIRQDLPSWSQVLWNLTYLQNFVGVTNVSMGFWTLCLEFQFYLSFLALMLVAGRLPGDRFRNASAMLLPLVALSLYLFSADVFHARNPQVCLWDAYVSLLPNIIFFALGISAYWATNGRAPAWVFFAICLAAAVDSFYARPDPLIAAIATAIVLFVASKTNKMQSWGDARPLLFLGTISYSLYLVHFPIGRLPILASRKLFGIDTVPAPALVLVGASTGIVAAWFMYRFIEKPSVEFSKRMKRFEASPKSAIAPSTDTASEAAKLEGALSEAPGGVSS